MRRKEHVIRGSVGAMQLLVCVATVGCSSPDEADGGEGITVGPLDRSVPADGWRWESSLGVEVAVPDDWKINDTDCNQTDAPSVVRGQGLVQDCLTAEPLTKQIVEIAGERVARDVARPEHLTYADVMIGSVAAERGEGETLDGRAAGWLHVPSISVVVDVRVKDADTLQKVLDSVRIVDTDHNQCATSRKDMSPAAPKAATLAPSNARAVSVCYFDGAGILQASTLLDGVKAKDLTDALNASKPGRNVDVPETNCLRQSEPPQPDAVLIVHGEDDNAQIELTFSSCSHRGLSNGRSEAQLTTSVLQTIMNPLSCGYSFHPFSN